LKRLERVRKDAVREALQDKNRRMSKKNLGVHDHDTRAKVNFARLSGRDRTGGRKAAALETALGRNKAALQAVDAVRRRKTGAGLRGVRSERPVLFFAPEGEVHAADYAITHPALEIKNDSRIVISGDNGSGKTTVLEHIGKTLNTSGLKFWYLHQQLSGADRQNVLKKLHALGE